jgi:hypothetical protein
VNIRFGEDGAILDLKRAEYGFLYLTLSYVLHGIRLSENDFRNVLGMSRAQAEELLSEMDVLEAEARARGDHWNPTSATG